MANFYDYSILDSKNNEVKMSDLKGKVVMIVNTATGCGFTPQYEPIEKMYEKYHDQGLEILDIPCNQFGNQAPGTDEEIHEFCTLHYNTTFPQMKKADVNGENELPLYTFLKTQKGFEGFKGIAGKGLEVAIKKMIKDLKENDTRWNFTKFIVNKDGEVVARFEPTHDMKKVEEYVVSLL